MTGWASVWNSDEGARLAASPDPERTFLEEIRLQLEYVQRRSMLVDLQIIAQTAAVLLRRRRLPAGPSVGGRGNE